MGEVATDIPVAHYVGLDDEVQALEFGVLPACMSAIEFNYMLANTNKELQCMLLGMIPSEGSISSQEIIDELRDRGAGELETDVRNCIDRALGRIPMATVVREDDKLSLTPLGEAERDLAGHQLSDISPLAALANVYGNTYSYAFDSIATLPHVRRILLIRALARQRASRIAQASLSTEMQEAGFPRGFTLHYMNGFHKAKLVDIEKDDRGRTYIRPRPVIKQLGQELLTLTQRTVTRDPDYREEGRAKLEKVLNSADLPYIVRRSILTSGQQKIATGELAQTANNIIMTGDGPMTSKAIYERLDPETKARYTDIKSFRSTLQRSTGLVKSPIYPVRDGHQFVWYSRQPTR